MEDRLTAAERELRLLREGFNRHAAEERAANARAEQRDRELMETLSASIDRLAAALQEYNQGRAPDGGNGPGTVRKLTPRPKGSHRA